MEHIGIVGAGIAGLHLGLFLQQHGVATTIYTDRAPDQLRASRLATLPARWPQTRLRERALGVDHWQATDVDTYELHVAGEFPLAIHGHSRSPLNSVDMRLYQATLLEDFAARGGAVVVGPADAQTVDRLSKRHALMVVAAGGGELARMFPMRPEYSPYAMPQRHLCAGLWHGITLKAPRSEALIIAPGRGEIILAPYETFDGVVMGMLVEAIPGGPFDMLMELRYHDDPRRFEATLLERLRTHVPWIEELVDPAEFGVTHPRDLLQGAITPVVRRGYSTLSSGVFALALGDTHVLNDPITAQGANVASRAAWILGQAIADDPVFDLRFCQSVEQRILEYALPVTAWTNAMLQPPAPHALEFMVAASHIPSVADAFVEGYNTPSRLWHLLSDARRTGAFLHEAGWTGLPGKAVAD